MFAFVSGPSAGGTDDLSQRFFPVTSNRGTLIAAMGLPGCGKSSVFSELAAQHGLQVFCEPEEVEWPEAVHQRDTVGCFTAITWFRSRRVPQLFRADELRRSGSIVLVDSCYDKLLVYYLGSPGMEWLIDPDDPYYDLVYQMAKKDRDYLPDPDVVVAFRLDRETWFEFLRYRGRALDKDPGVLESYPTQAQFLNAARRYCEESGARLLEFEQAVSSPESAAARLADGLGELGVPLAT